MDRMFVTLSPDVERLVADNGLDLAALLRERGLDVKSGREADPTALGAGTKEPALSTWTRFF
jgi:hypothetical protein